MTRNLLSLVWLSSILSLGCRGDDGSGQDEVGTDENCTGDDESESESESESGTSSGDGDGDGDTTGDGDGDGDTTGDGDGDTTGDGDGDTTGDGDGDGDTTGDGDGDGDTGGEMCDPGLEWAEPGCQEPPNPNLVTPTPGCYEPCEGPNDVCLRGTCQEAWIENLCPCPPWEQFCCDGCGGGAEWFCL